MTGLYRGYLETLSRRFKASLESIASVYAFERGDEFELVLCEVLRSILPQKYGICRGFAVNSKGDVAGDDIIIFDRNHFPTMQLRDESFSRLESIPIEAIYAYIEAKHTLDLEGDGDASLRKAWKQAAAVRNLCEQRSQIPPEQIDRYTNLAGLKVDSPPDFPTVSNPMFSMVISRYVKAGKEMGQEAIRKALMDWKLPEGDVDLIIAGEHQLVLPVIQNAAKTESVLRSPFYLPGRSQHLFQTADGLAFGVGIAMLLFALDWIRLGSLPWHKIILDGLNGPK
jgi:hypothetical protein